MNKEQILYEMKRNAKESMKLRDEIRGRMEEDFVRTGSLYGEPKRI